MYEHINLRPYIPGLVQDPLSEDLPASRKTSHEASDMVPSDINT